VRGYRTVISAGFEKGLRPEAVTKRNSGLFIEVKGARISQKVLEGYRPDVNNFSDEIYKMPFSHRWPFPQLFLTDVGLFIGALEGLYWISDHSTDPMGVYDFLTGSVVWPWSCAPIDGYPAFSSGSCLVYYDANAAAYQVVT
jgi:hypothetical protein